LWQFFKISSSESYPEDFEPFSLPVGLPLLLLLLWSLRFEVSPTGIGVLKDAPKHVRVCE
jgi:hypothetical protein